MVPPRSLLLGALGLLLAAPPAQAQERFRLVSPTLLVGTRSLEVVGGPLEQDPFGHLVLTVPGVGRYVVSDRPFEGARRAGQFSGETLAFTVEGQSLRLRASAPLLSSPDPVYAYVRREPAGDAVGPAVVSLSGARASVADAPASPPEDRRARAVEERLQDDAERDRLRRDAARLREEVSRLEREVARLRAPAPRTGSGPETASHLRARVEAAEAARNALVAQVAALRAERDDLAERVRALEAERDDLRATRAHLERDQALLAAERDALHREAEALRADLLLREGAPAVTLPGFDWSRLRNADAVSTLLQSLDVPRTALPDGAGGDALVLFATDGTGRVTEAAVAEPLGRGLDALAERVVRAMAFVPPVVDGTETGFRSQVVVRFRP
ncbi:MAG: TonB family protein [Rubricoccaceae bacterium]|nr:TonB family protein [Rubricoccaceae bacterium]